MGEVSPLDEEVEVESDDGDGDVFRHLHVADAKLDAMFEQLKARDEGGEPPTGKGASKGAAKGASKGAPKSTSNGASNGASKGASTGASNGRAAKAAPQLAEEEFEVEEEVEVDLVEDEIEVEVEDEEAMDVGSPGKGADAVDGGDDDDDDDDEDLLMSKGASWKAGKGRRRPPANGKGKGAKPDTAAPQPGAGGVTPGGDVAKPAADPEAGRGGEAAAPKAEPASATKGKGKRGGGKKDRREPEPEDSDDSASSDSAPRKKAKQDTGPPTGTVKSFLEEKGFGFVRPALGGDDLFFHVMAVQNKGDRSTIPVGSEMTYETEMQMGRLKVTTCTVTKWAEDDDGGKGGKGKGKWDAWAWGPWAWGKGADPPDAGQGGGAPSKDEAAKEPASVAEWIQAQDRVFGHMGKLPANWIRIRSKSSGKVYLYNTKTGESKDGDSMEAPKSLPPNWTKLTSKSTGQTYYYNNKTGQSQFDEP